MNERQLHFDWDWQLNSTPDELWPLISDTNRLYSDLQHPALETTNLSCNSKSAHAPIAHQKKNHSNVWEEEPYEWQQPFRFSVKRHSKNGSYRYLRIEVELIPNEEGTRVRYQIWMTTENCLSQILTPLRMKIVFRQRLGKTLEKFDALTQQNLLPYQLEDVDHLVRGGRKQLLQFQQELISKTGHIKIVTKLVDFLAKARDIDVHTINPYMLADHWEMPRRSVLNIFLEATKIGMLIFNWDLYCPNCRSLQERCKTLHEIHETIFCDECQRTFCVNFSRNIQLSFHPSSLIRKSSDKACCLNGPQSNPHIAVKQYLEPDQKRFLKVSLPHGTYRMHLPDTKGDVQITVSDRGEKEIGISICNRVFDREPVQMSSNANLILHNRSDRKQLVILENCSWESQLLTAATVTSRQQFRDLFEEEVLPKGKKIAVDNQTLMFTDLIGSTGMYNKEGDQIAVERVIDHFDVLHAAVSEENGAIVKTIGDSVMAVFSNPTDAYKAYRRAQQVISSDKRYNNSLQLKAGIHHGNCVAVNLNNRIDYFGSTVNIASRLVDFADGDEVVLTRSACKSIDNDELQLSDHPSKEIKIRLRGFDNEEFRVKQIALKESALKLVV